MREDYLNLDNKSISKDKEFENILRPKSFKDFYGQDQIINNIKNEFKKNSFSKKIVNIDLTNPDKPKIKVFKP